MTRRAAPRGDVRPGAAATDRPRWSTTSKKRERRSRTGSLNVSVTVAGAVFRRAPGGGCVLSSCAWACATAGHARARTRARTQARIRRRLRTAGARTELFAARLPVRGEAVPVDPQRRLGAIGDAERLEDVRDVRLDRL